jgi:hypothetical protein
MNFEDIGLTICKVRDKNYSKKFKDIKISIGNEEDNDKVKHLFNNVELTERDEILQHMPYKSVSSGNNRQILYISGQSGSGKSYYTAAYMKEYNIIFPKNNIYIFSSLLEDKTLDNVKMTKRIKLDEKFFNTPLSIKDFTDCLVVYDDTEMITNVLIQQKITNILNLILTTGRHTGTYVIITSHQTNNRDKTKLILIEAHSITLFIATMGDAALKYVLETSFGLSSKQIKEISDLKSKSRWVTILKTYPSLVMYEKGIYILGKK